MPHLNAILEVWRRNSQRRRPNEKGETVKYSLAYINPSICDADNGRVLGYDNSHDYHHRRLSGTIEQVEFDDYESLSVRFHAEVIELWRKEDDERE